MKSYWVIGLSYKCATNYSTLGVSLRLCKCDINWEGLPFFDSFRNCHFIQCCVFYLQRYDFRIREVRHLPGWYYTYRSLFIVENSIYTVYIYIYIANGTSIFIWVDVLFSSKFKTWALRKHCLVIQNKLLIGINVFDPIPELVQWS